MIRTVVNRGASVQLLGPVRGLLREVDTLMPSLDEFLPGALGLGVSGEELRSLTDHFVGTEQEPVVPLTSTELAEIRGLARFGEVRVPNPAMVAAIAWAKERGVRTEALDPSDDRYATMFADTISYVELVRRTVRQRKFTRRPPTARDPEEYALAWEQYTAGGRDSLRFAYQRDGVLLEGVQRLAERAARVSVVVDRERFARVAEMLQGTNLPTRSAGANAPPGSPPEGRPLA